MRDPIAPQEQLRAAYAAMACGVVIVSGHGDIADANDAAQQILGLSLDQMRGQPLLASLRTASREDGSLLPDGERPAMVALRTGTPQHGIVMGITRPDGERRWLQVDAVPVRGADGLWSAQRSDAHVVCSFIDITPRVQIEDALRESELRFRSVTQSANDAIISIDSQGLVTFWNMGAQTIFGYAEDEVMGRPLDFLMPERYREAHRRGVERMSATGEPRVIGQTIELHGLRKDGSEFPLELSLAAWATAAGTGYSGIIRDITARKQAEAVLALQYATATVLAASAMLSEAIPTLLQTVCNHLGWDVGLFWSADPSEGVLRCRDLWHGADISIPHFAALSRQCAFAPGVGLPGRVWASGAPVLLADVADALTDANVPRAETAGMEGLRAAFCFPIPAKSDVDSIMEFFSRDARPPDAALVQAISAVCAQIGQFIERTRIEEALHHQALHDALTDLPNRTLLHDRLLQALHTARRERASLALLLMDLNRFKEVNDTLGHHFGDVLLQQVSLRLRDMVRASDTVARLGGDEFAVLMPGTDTAGAIQVAHKILAAFAEPFTVEGRRLEVGTSIGITASPDDSTDAPTLLRRADVAMYVAKRAGSGYAVYDPKHDQHSPARLMLESELRQAIAQDQLLLYYQPKVELGTGRVCGVEALVRWLHPEHGLIPPDQFIPLAEQTGMIAPITHWVLGVALGQCRAWQRRGIALGVAVNLSMRMLHDPRLPDTIAWLLRQHEIAPHTLTLEITESTLMADPAQALMVLTRLSELGARISIDDFGTGYSSLGYLKQLPVDEIKIDKSFVLGMGADRKDTAIVRSISELSHNLGLSVVAEGVENREARDLLAVLGCDTAQGYYLSRPLPAGELEHWMQTSPWGLRKTGS